MRLDAHILIFYRMRCYFENKDTKTKTEGI